MSLRPVRLRAMAAALLLVCLPTLGCSWITVNKPPQGPIEPARPLACTTGVAAPLADTAMAGLLVVGGIVGVTQQEQCVGEMFCNLGANIAGIGALVAAAPAVISAIYGYSTTAECRQLEEAQLSCTSGVEEACLTLKERK